MEKQPEVIFDFDGVIADSFLAAFLATKAVCATVSSEEEYKAAYDKDIYEWADDPRLHSQDCRHEKFYDYLPGFVKQTAKLFKGIDQVLARLALTYPLHIVSSNSALVVEDFLRQHNLRSVFGQILGYEFSQSKVEKLSTLKSGLGYPTNLLYVTDTVGDINEVREAGLLAIAVTWGFCPEEALVKAQPFAVVRKPNELVGEVDRYFSNL